MRPQNVLKIFLASPSDVNAEREAITTVVSQTNDTLGDWGARLELVRWETHTYPDIGTDAQDAVNQQVGDDFDVLSEFSGAGLARLRHAPIPDELWVRCMLIQVKQRLHPTGLNCYASR